MRRRWAGAAAGLLLAVGAWWVPVASGSAVADPRITIGDARVVEGHGVYRVVQFAVTLSQTTDRNVSVSFSTRDGTARDGSDYLARSAGVNIPAGTRSAVFGVNVAGDTRIEGNETFRVRILSATHATITRASATGTILDDDPPGSGGGVQLSIGDASVVEGDSGGRYAALAVTLSAKTNHKVNASWRTEADTASLRAGDFVGDSGTMHIAAGDTSTALPVTIKGDRKDESNETLRVVLSNVAGATLHRSRGTVTILDDDPYIPPATTTTAPAPDNTRWAWGYNWAGQAGVGGTADHHSPVQDAYAADWTAVAAGEGHACGIRSPGTLWCWGNNDNGALGDGTHIDRHNPRQVGTSSNWTHVATGREYSCGIRAGTMRCWGSNTNGQLGDSTTTARDTPFQVGGPSSWTDLALGVAHSCGISSPGTLWCWGANDYGQLGDNTTGDRHSPHQVGSATNWTSVATGSYHSCAIRGTGTLWCWGSNDEGGLGDGTITQRLAPTQVGSADGWTDVAGGWYHTCGIRGAGTLWCWGNNSHGQVGDGSTDDRLVPTQVGSYSNWARVTTGLQHSCGIRSGTLWCWGRNNFGELGDGTTDDQHAPVRVGAASDWYRVSAASHHTAGIRS